MRAETANPDHALPNFSSTIALHRLEGVHESSGYPGPPLPEQLQPCDRPGSSHILEAEGHQVVFHDLYAEGFDPILGWKEIPKGWQIDGTIAMHCRDLVEAEGIIVVHPNWWACLRRC